MKSKKMIGALCGIAMAFNTLSTSALADSPTMIGVNLSGGDFGTSALPGVLGTNYFYPSAAHWDWAKGQGMELVRVPFRWERIQHETEGVLDANLWAPDLAALDASLDLAEARGMRVVLDMHNYAEYNFVIAGSKVKYKVGTTQLPASALANTWKLLANHFKDRKCIWGYDIMNEANGIAGGAQTWAQISQTVVTAIREVDMKTPIVLEGYFYAQAHSWLTNGAPLLNVVDPANNLIFSAHMYPDRGSDGLWNNGGTVQAELVNSGEYPTVEDAHWVGRNRIKPFVDWCVANNVRGLVGEYGSTRALDTENWAKILENTLDYIRDNGNGLVSATQWGGGPWNSTYTIGMGARRDNSNAPFMPMVRDYVSGPGTNFWYSFLLYDETVTTTADYTFTYVYPNTTPATITFNLADTSTAFAGTKSAAMNYTVPSGGFAGAGIHIRGPLSVGAVGGVDLSMSLAAGHVLSFYAKGTPGASPRITFGTTLNASGVDSGADTGTGNWINIGTIKPLTAEWQRYEIPLSAFLNAQVTGTTRVQRLRFDALPANGSTFQVNLDRITIGVASTNTAPSITVNTSTGAGVYSVGQSIGLVATASDGDAGDSIDYVEFFINEKKVGIDDTAPYQAAAVISEPGVYELRALTFDSHGIPKQSAPKTLTVASGPFNTATLTGTAGHEGWIAELTSTSGTGGSVAIGKPRLGDDVSNRRYVSILSFDTSSIPDGATILSATLQLRRDGLTGTSPFSTHGAAAIAVHSTYFGSSTALEPADFSSPATVANAGFLNEPTANGSFSTASLSGAGLNAINKTGVTQFRLSHAQGDNADSGADVMQFNASSDATPAKRPTLIINYQ